MKQGRLDELMGSMMCMNALVHCLETVNNLNSPIDTTTPSVTILIFHKCNSH